MKHSKSFIFDPFLFSLCEHRIILKESLQFYFFISLFFFFWKPTNFLLSNTKIGMENEQNLWHCNSMEYVTAAVAVWGMGEERNYSKWPNYVYRKYLVELKTTEKMWMGHTCVLFFHWLINWNRLKLKCNGASRSVSEHDRCCVMWFLLYHEM